MCMNNKDFIFEELVSTYEAQKQSLRNRMMHTLDKIDDGYDHKTLIAELDKLVADLASIEVKLHVLDELHYELDDKPRLLLD